jgi:hypothetical protein
MKNNNAEKHFQKWIEGKVPKELQNNYGQIICTMRAGFYEGIKFSLRVLRKNEEKFS